MDSENKVYSEYISLDREEDVPSILSLFPLSVSNV